MTPERFARMQEIFTETSELPEAEREPHLRRVCGDDKSLLEEVQSLLQYAGREDAFQNAERARPPSAPGDPTTIGRYQILERLGEGGMGVVYKAQQLQPLRRTVAIKIIKLGIDTREVIARFEMERQVLAQMDHPNIARVFDAEITSDGRPYFVMEYVPGSPITTFADQHKLTLQQRLEIFMLVCEAIMHAHQRGIIHRDIKAGNVLAYMLDEKPTVKVIDFGIAKALTGDRLTDATFSTEQGKVVGTYNNMSPEQAEGRSDIDTRTDVYSLGVLLYELLAGTKPFEHNTLAHAADNEIRRIIREVEPPRPSQRLTALGADGEKIAAARQARLLALKHQLRDELEWIPLMAMRKDRDRRYTTPRQMADDIRNHLQGRPLAAGPEGNLYRIRKFVRRNRVVATASVAILLSLIGGITATTVQSIEARRARRAADVNAAAANDNAALAERSRVEAENNLSIARRQQEAARFSAYCFGLLAINSLATANDVLPARERATSLPAEFQGWEYNYLLSQLDQSMRTLRHETIVWDVAWSDDGQRLATAADTGMVRIWNAKTGEQLRVFSDGKAQAAHLCFSPGSGRLAAAFTDGTSIVWTLSDDRHETYTASTKDNAEFIGFSRQGNVLAIPSGHAEAQLYEVATRRLICELKGHAGRVRGIAFSPDDRHVFTVSDDTTMRQWNATTGEMERVFKGHSDGLTSVAMNRAGTLLVTTSNDKTVGIWNPENGAVVHQITGFADCVRRAAFSRDERFLVVGGYDRISSIYSVEDWNCRSVLRGHDHFINSLAVSPSNDEFATASTDGTAKIWTLPTWDQSNNFKSESEFRKVCWLSGGTRLLTWASPNRLQFIDVNTGASTPGPTAASEITATATNADGSLIACGGVDAVVRLYRTGVTEPKEWRGHAAVIRSVAISPDGQCVASGDDSGSMRLWSTADNKLIKTMEGHSGEVSDLTFSPDVKWLISASHDGSLKRWAIPNGDLVETIRDHEGSLSSVSFSRDGTLLATGSFDRTIAIRSVRANGGSTLLSRLRGHTEIVATVGFSPDGSRLVSGGYDRAVRLWYLDDRESYKASVPSFDPQSGRIGTELMSLRDCKSTVSSVAFSPDGRTLAAASADHILHVWRSVPNPP